MTFSTLQELSTAAATFEKSEKLESTTRQAWLMVLSASLFFFYEFIQMNLFNAISAMLMKDFSINAAQLGELSSFYLIANVIFLFPAGILLDRCSTRKIILNSLIICILGTIGLSLTTSFFSAICFRFLTGIGSAFCFLSVIRLSSRWFPARKMAYVTGVVVTIAMIGGMAAQTPMTLLTQTMGWRHALFIDAGLGVLIFFIIYCVVRDYPSYHSKTHQAEQNHIHELGYWKSMRLAFLRTQNWLASIYVCLMNLPLGLLGGLWGVLYLKVSDGFSNLDASYVTSMLFLGTIIGSPIVGFISDKIGLRRLPMLIGACLSFLLFLMILLIPHLNLLSSLFLFLLLGIATSSQIIGYPFVAENSPRMITAMSVSVVNITVQGGIAIFQPLFGYLLDEHSLFQLHHLTTHFIASDFHRAMFLFPVILLIALLATLALKESYCRST